MIQTITSAPDLDINLSAGHRDAPFEETKPPVKFGVMKLHIYPME